MSERILDVRGLRVSFATHEGTVRAVDGVDFALNRREVTAIVGESGSGKSATALTMLGLTRARNATLEGVVEFEGDDLMRMSDAKLRTIRGRRIAMIFQDPMTSLNPVKPVGDQIVEAIRAHDRVARAAARRRAGELLEQVGIAQARDRLDDHPHRFSGGMRQRAMIAMAIACNPDVLIADEPTTALDVTIQAQIFELLARVREETASAMILITHDLGLATTVADSALVMYGGRIVERGAVGEVFRDPQHPYTWGLLGAIPRLDRPRPRRLYSIGGAPPQLGEAPSGCRFRSRCPHAFDACTTEPGLAARGAAPGHEDRCWIAGPARAELRPESVVGGGTR